VAPDQILAAAQVVFAEQGLQAATLRAIARQTGCDPALIYYHFDSKEALFQALLDRRFPQVFLDISALAEPTDTRPTVQRLWDVLLVYHHHLRQEPGLRAMIRGEMVRGAGGLRDLIETRVRPILGCVAQIIEQGQARGELRPELNPLLSTFFLVKMQMEILDVLPAVLPLFLPQAPEDSLVMAMRGWLELYWRGVALDPAAPLPALPDPAE